MDAAGWKAKGNEEFTAKRFPEAIEAFTKAIEQDGSNHVLYSNRSACYASLNKWPEAKADADKCVQYNSSWAKGYIRLGAALHGLKEYEAAEKAYEDGLAIEPENTSLLSGLESVMKDRQAEETAGGANPFGKMFGPDSLERARRNPKLAPYCAQQDYVQIMTMIGQNPSLVSGFMKDQRIMHTMLEFSGIDMDSLKKPAGSGPGAAGAGQYDSDPVGSSSSSAPAPKPAAKPASSSSSSSAANLTTAAAKLKEEGNALYKQRKFDEALEKYQAAFELEPNNTTFLLNQTAVYFEKGDFDVCYQKCEEAMEHGREHKADYPTIAKLMTRQASCLQKKGQYDEAIALFQKALLEHRNADTLTKLDACKKEKKIKDEESYLDEGLGLKAKEEGNAHFKADRFPEAVKCYEEAAKRNPKDHTVFSNRAAALLKLTAYEDAIKDCDKCLAIKPDFAKAFVRKGHAYFWTKQYNKALSQYEEAIKLDPTFQEAIDGRNRTIAKIQENASGEGDEEAAQRAMQDPEIQAILQDSYMQLVLSEMQKDPKKINDYLRDPGISQKLNKLIMAGVLRVGNGPAQGEGKRGGGRR
jgi:stress-induced-phosphoprotein 1